MHAFLVLSVLALYKMSFLQLLVDNNFLYYGIQDRGFFRYSLKNGTHENLNSDNNLDPLCLKEINGTIYAGSSAGILLMRKDDSHFVKEKLEIILHIKVHGLLYTYVNALPHIHVATGSSVFYAKELRGNSILIV